MMRHARKGDDPYGTDLMFEVAKPVAMRGEGSRAKAPRSAEFAYCPSCHPTDRKGLKRTGLIRQGAHLVWRQHNLVTWSGGRRPCISSGVPVCQHPPTHGIVINCTCATAPGAA